jgi:hypothetical protein
MKLIVFFVVMATIAAGVERMLARINRNDGDLHGGGWHGVPPGADDAGHV